MNKWQKGDLQVHFIYTGVGEQIFFIFPDTTTLLIDCGETDTLKYDPSPIPVSVQADGAGPYVADYILRTNPAKDPSHVDYFLLSHYHNDHTGGLPALIERIHFGKAFDRTWPDVDFPCKLSDYDGDGALDTMREVYGKMSDRDGTPVEKWHVGERDQLKLLNGGAKDFSIFNLCANGFVADETTGEIFDLYRDYPDKQPGFKGNQFGKQWINENGMSTGFILTYGAFRFFCAGDFSDCHYGHNIENEMAPHVRSVTVAKLNHHGHNSMFEDLTAVLRPKEWFSCIWNHHQNTAATVSRITDRSLYPGDRRIHSCFFSPQRPCDDVADKGLYEGRTVVLTVHEGGEKYDIDYLNPFDDKAARERFSMRKTPPMIAPNGLLPRPTEWRKMSPTEIVDAWYKPNQKFDGWVGEKLPIKYVPDGSEPWAKMKTEDFLPCVDKYGQFKHRDWPGKTHSDEELKTAAVEEEQDLAAHPGPQDRDKFGGWSAGPQLEATGRFRTHKDEHGKWWLVDPEGHLFWSFGAVRVTPSSALTPLNGNPRKPLIGGPVPDRDCLFDELPAADSPFARFYDTYDELLLKQYLNRGETRRYDHSAANLYRKYGEDWYERFADSCHRRLRSWGANTIANSSDLRICLQDRTPYAERVEVQSRPIAGSWGEWFKFRDPFDPSFAEGVTKSLEEHGREAHDEWCIGFFIDNEIQWGRKDTDLAQWTLWSPDDQPAKIEFLKRLAAKGIDPRKGDEVPEVELKAFTQVIADEYFKRTRETVKAFDPKLLYLGCRFAGWAPPWAIGPCAKYCDVVSYNIYHESLADWRLPQNLDAPVLIGEFHFGAFDRGLFGASLVNKRTQEGRAEAIKQYVNSALGNPQIVGVHWHQFSDQPVAGRFDGENFQVGWTDVCDRPYPETRAALREVGYDMYKTRARGSMFGA